jgi:ATP-binding cassette subfamily C protein LapB
MAPTFREVLVLSFCVNLLALAVPVFVLQVYDRVVFHAGLSTLEGLTIGMAIVIAFDFVMRQTRARILQTVALRADVEVGRRLFDKLMSLPLSALESRPASHWHALFRDVEIIRNTVSGASAVLVADLPFVLLFLGLTFVIAASIAWILLLVLPLFLFIAWRSGATVAAASRAERDAGLGRDRLISELIQGRTTVKALALDAAMRPLWEERHAQAIQRSVVRGAQVDSYTALGTSLTMLTTVVLTAAGALAIINQELTIGALIATNILSGRLLGPLNQLVATWRNYAGFRQSVDRLGLTFALPSERLTSEISLPRPRGDIALESIRFAYGPDDRPVIDNLRFEMTCPGIYGVIGHNGSGKTTLLKLVQGLYAPSAGRVLLDGADISQFTRRELAAWIGYVPQECVLFAGSIRNNIAHRKPDASDEEIIRASSAAGVHAFIVELPDGYATDVGEAGRRLSAGQRQRIAIARALIGDPPALLLDEPSGNLDRQAEHDLRETMVRLGRERTVVLVTHSPLLLPICDKLIVLDHGRIAMAGPAAEVLPRLVGRGRPVTATRPQKAGGTPLIPVPDAPASSPAKIGSEGSG